MFYNCSSLVNLDLSNFDTSSLTTMGCMFRNCSKLTSLDLSNFDFTNVNVDGSFSNTPSGISIYVKDEAAKEFILNNKADANVIIPESI